MVDVLAQPVEQRLYTRQFVQVFGAVLLFMTGVALQFHFGQYVQFLDHGVDALGRILSISMVGTLLIRLQVGRWIDRFGCRPSWLVGALVFAITTAAMPFASQLWMITMLRTLAAMSMAGVMTTVAVFAAHIAPPGRRAESIGTLGLAGLIGIMVGPTMGDVIFSAGTGSIGPYRVFFWASALCGLLSAVVILLLTTPLHEGQPLNDVAGDMPSMRTQIAVILKHWPGTVLLVGVVFHMVFCVQSLFLERLAEARGFQDIKIYFLIYSPTAIALRIVFRRLPERFGRTRTLLAGLLLLALGLGALVGADTQWQLILPGLLMGAGHSFIFPSMVDLTAERLPAAYRGTGTSLILASGDLGMLLGYATLGELIDAFGYDQALIMLLILVLLAAAVFASARRRPLLRRRG